MLVVGGSAVVVVVAVAMAVVVVVAVAMAVVVVVAVAMAVVLAVTVAMPVLVTVAVSTAAGALWRVASADVFSTHVGTLALYITVITAHILRAILVP